MRNRATLHTRNANAQRPTAANHGKPTRKNGCKSADYPRKGRGLIPQPQITRAMPAKKKPPVKKAAGKKSRTKGGGNSLLSVGLDILASIASGVVQAVWDSATKPRRAPAKQNNAEAAEPSRKKSRERQPPAWWKVLGVRQDASREEISRAYRDLMTGCHPDKVAHLSPQLRKVAEREAKKVNAAREAALQDHDRR